MLDWLVAKKGTFNRDAKLFASGVFSKEVPAKATRSGGSRQASTGWKPDLLCIDCAVDAGVSTWAENVSRVDFAKVSAIKHARGASFANSISI